MTASRESLLARLAHATLPLYDTPVPELLERIGDFLRKSAVEFTTEPPGNDLRCHRIALPYPHAFDEFLIRFDLSAYTLTHYGIATATHRTHERNGLPGANSRRLMAFLDASGLDFMPLELLLENTPPAPAHSPPYYCLYFEAD